MKKQINSTIAGALALAAGAVFQAEAGAQTLNFDIVVAGGSFSAPAVALQAARTNPDAKILLIEPTDWLGGQATTQGVAAIDNAWHNPGATLMRNNPPLYYAADYLDFLNRIKSNPTEAPGYGYGGDGVNWVSRESFDPRSAAWILEQMVAEHANITFLPMSVVKQVQTEAVTDEFGNARKITSLELIQRTPKVGYTPFQDFLSEEILDWYTRTDSSRFTKASISVLPADEAKGMVVIDASELGDVVVLAGADYTVGRELTTEKFNENGTPPAYDEDGSQAFVYPFCMTTAATPDPENDVKAWFTDFDVYYNEQVSSFYSLGAFTWARVWTYRRLYTPIRPINTNTVYSGDISMQNWNPGNDYPYGTPFKVKSATNAELSDWMGGINVDQFAAAEKHAVGFYFYMKALKTVAWDTRLARGDDAQNMMGTASGLSKFPYMRCIRRITGLENFRIVGNTFVNTHATEYVSGTSFRFYDSVGIGSYAADVHGTRISTGINPPIELPAPFYIPYRALASNNVRNLLASGKLMAQTYVTNSAYRLHPIEWASGSAAGAAAAIMLETGETNRHLADIDRVRALQNEVRTNSPIHWAAYDTNPIPPNNGDLIVNEFKPLSSGTPFPVEAYHPRAVRAEVFRSSIPLGTTTTRANGRLLLQVPTIPSGTWLITAVLYGPENEQLDTLEKQVTVGGVNSGGLIVDNNDPDCVRVGSWIVGTAQGDKYGTNYHYADGNAPLRTATFSFTIEKAGLYEISTWYPAAGNRAVDAPYTIHHAGGQTTVPINQQINGGRWVALGRFTLQPGQNHRVVLSNQIANTAQLVLADAVQARLIESDAWMVF